MYELEVILELFPFDVSHLITKMNLVLWIPCGYISPFLQREVYLALS